MVEILINKLKDDTKLPIYATQGAVGLDVYARKEYTLGPHSVTRADLGFAVAIPEGYELQVRPRSGLAVRNITVANSPGTIDSDYRGEVAVLLANNSYNARVIEAGSRIAQLVPAKVTKLKWKEVSKLPDTDRGEGGFGSTGA